MESNPLAGLLSLLMLLQLAVVLAVLLGGLYALYCLNRAAAGLDRLASAVESWVVQAAKFQAQQAAQSNPLPGQTLQPSAPTPPEPPTPPSPPAPAGSDWMRPIELPGNVTSSNSVSEATPVSNMPAASPHIPTASSPTILPSSPPFGHDYGDQEEEKRD